MHGLLKACLLFVTLTYAADGPPKDPFKRESPQSSVAGFIESYHAGDFEKARRYLNLRSLPTGQRQSDGIRLTKDLGKILERDAQFEVAGMSTNPLGDVQDKLPPEREHVASFDLKGNKAEIQLERITLYSGLPIWVFSSESLALVPQLVRATSDSAIERILPAELSNWTFFDMALWRWIALLLIIAILAICSGLFVRLVLSVVDYVLKRWRPLNRELLNAFSGPLRLLLFVSVFDNGVDAIGVTPKVHVFVDRTASMLYFGGLFWLSAILVDLALLRLRKVLQARHETFSHSVLPLMGRVLKITILVFTVAAILSTWGYNTNTLLAGLGVGGIAVALAAQKTIENFFGGVSVIGDSTVRVGDVCKFGDRTGTVEEIGLRSIRVRSPERTVVNVPSGQFSSMIVENFTLRDKMMFHLMLNLRRDTTPDQVRTLLEVLRDILTNHPKVEIGNMPVRFVGVGTYSLDIELSAFILTLNGDEFLLTQQDLLLRILDAVKSAGTSLALPTQASIAYSYGQEPSNERPDNMPRSNSLDVAWR